MITLTVNGIKKEIPTSWADIKFSEYELLTNMDELETVGFFLGMTKKELKQYTEIQNYDMVVGALSFLTELPQPNNLDIIYDGKPLKYDLDVLDICIGQYRDAIEITNMIKPSLEESNKQIKLLIATYLQPIIDECPYDAAKVDILVNTISQKLSVQDYINIQSFFLNKLIKLKSGTKTTYTKLNIIKKKIWQVYQTLRNMVLG